MLEAAYDSTERIVVVRLAKHQPVETHSLTGAPGAEFSETLLAWDLSTRTVRWSQSTTEVSRDGPEVTLLWLDPDGPGPTRK